MYRKDVSVCYLQFNMEGTVASSVGIVFYVTKTNYMTRRKVTPAVYPWTWTFKLKFQHTGGGGHDANVQHVAVIVA